MQNQWQRLVWTVPALLCLLVLSAGPATAADQEKDDEYYELMKTFVDTFDQIERSYVKDVDRRELLESAIRGMLSNLDQYSSYISSQDLERFNQVVDQEFGGVGIQVTIDDETKRLTVMTPLPGTPAYREGVRAGDVIMEIEGESTEGFTLEDAVKLLKGNPGEAVTIGVRHPGSDTVKQIEIVREVIRVSTVLGDRYQDDDHWDFFLNDEHKIGYIRLTHFSRRSAEELRETLESLQAEGMKGLVLDLRFNPGGLLSQATEIADLFIESGTIVSTKGRNTPERSWDAAKKGTYTGFPMAVLVNRYSASASEIVSACLQDHKRAVVIGERTWGKGSVQNVVELENGQSALKLTTASYHRPSGKNIHKFTEAKDSDDWGVTPDEGYELKLSRKETEKYLDDRRARDVLGNNDAPKEDFTDRQLGLAVDYLLEELGVAEKSSDPSDKNAKEKPEPARAEQPDATDDSEAQVPRKLVVPAQKAA